MAVGVLKYSLDGGVTWLPMLGGPQGEPGIDGVDGVGIPVGGTTGQVLAKSSATDYDVSWNTTDSETFANTNLPLSWSYGLQVVKSGTLVNISGQQTCLTGQFLAPVGNAPLTIAVVPVGYRPQFPIYGTCVHAKIADIYYRFNLVVSVETTGNVTIWPTSGSTYPFSVNDTVNVSVSYRAYS